MTASVFVIRFLRSFEVERRRQISDLQAQQLREAQRREALRGELYRRVVGAQEAERQRIARELHDETGQSLTAIGMGMRSVQSLRSNRIGPKPCADCANSKDWSTDRSMNCSG